MPKLPRPPRWASMNFLRGAQPGLESLALASVLPSLGSSVAPVALPTLAMSFQVSFGTVQWVLLGYLLALTLGCSSRVESRTASDAGLRVTSGLGAIFMAAGLRVAFAVSTGLVLVALAFTYASRPTATSTPQL